MTNKNCRRNRPSYVSYDVLSSHRLQLIISQIMTHHLTDDELC